MSNRKRKGRVLNGLLLLDKPTGISSNAALQKVKRLFTAAKAGHTGTLDPLATGLLIICFGRATKISNYLLAADKNYEVLLELGVTTNTGDADGEVLERKGTSHVTDQEIHQNIHELTGSIEQVPPMFSALKYQGSRLYELARKGIEVERPSRQVKIHRFELLHREANILRLRVHCSKGTYIRTLVEDLGERLKCGAHVIELRRTSVGPFVNPKLVTISELEDQAQIDPTLLDAVLMPIDSALQDYPMLSIEQALMEKIRHGQAVSVPKSPTNGLVRLYDAKNQFYGLGAVLEDGRIAPKCLY